MGRSGSTKERAARLQQLKASGGYKAILDEAPSKVRETWEAAAVSCRTKVNEHLKNGFDVFLTFHAVYHADKFGDFYSPIDLRLLSAFPRPKKFLLLIDDIGDVATRLRRDGHVFSNRKKTGLESVVEAVRDLLTILEWRSSELVVSRLVGMVVDQLPFVLSVKHPTSTAVRLLLDEGVPTYISHSISESRRHFKKHNTWPPFMQEVQRFTDALTDPTGNGRGALPIVPTAIDELRISTMVVGGEELHVPSVLDRWDVPRGELLVPQEEGPESQRWLDPRGHFAGKLGGAIRSEVQRELKVVSGLLRALATRIDNQVNARDHVLVEQCPVLAVYRPYFAWRVTDGVAAEIKHQKDRLPAAPRGRNRRSIFVNRKPDDGLLRQLGRIIEGTRVFRWVRGSEEVTSDEADAILRDGLQKHAPPSLDADGIRGRVTEILREAGIEHAGPRERPKGVVLEKETATDVELETQRLWKWIAETAGAADTWKDRCDVWIEETKTPEEFASIVLAELSRSASAKAPRPARSPRTIN